MGKKTIFFLLVLAFLQLSLLGFVSMAEETGTYKIIVNSSNPISSLTKKQVSDLFLKKVDKWDHGLKVMPVDQSITAPVREVFSKEILNRSGRQVKSYWQQQLFSGSSVPPPEEGSDNSILNYVKANPGAIGYVSTSASVSDVKMVKIY